MKKIITIFLCLVLCAFGFAGCVKNPKPFDRGDVIVNLPTDTAGELKIGVKNDSTEIAIMNAFVESFELKYPNIDVTIEPMIATNYRETITQYYQADLVTPGSMPDILEFGTEIFEFIDNGIAMNIQDYVDASVQDGLLNLSDYYENIWNVGRKGGNGDQYMIARSYDHVVAYYNKAMFSQAAATLGIEESEIMPFNGWTWEDFLERMKLMRQAYDQTNRSNLFLVDAFLDWEAVYNAIYESFGVEYFDEDGNVKLDSDKTKAALELIKELVDEGIVGPFGGSSSNANFEGGQGCMMFHTIATKSRWYSKHGAKLDVATFPLIGENPVVGAGAVGYAIYGRSTKSNIAWAFLNHMLSADAQNAASTTGNIVPIRKDLAGIENEWAKYPVGSNINQEAFIFNTKYDKVTNFMTKVDPKFSYDIMEEIEALANNAFKVDKPMGIDGAINNCIKNLEEILSDPY